ncbi:MAG: UDP-N-acetylglucosamine 2-epimerase [Candidatus Peribacteraceae bacterium]|nr:UDP-N-acetylglucosamine 2-epimerase [Candidatus Peribacteraceae bacterium]
MEQVSFVRTGFLDDIGRLEAVTIHLILIATKPDIIKQVPLYKELQARGHAVFLVHTGQHYDENLSGGMLKEFGVQPDVNLNVRGGMHEVVSQIIGRFGWLLGELKSRGKTAIPYVHGDTTTAMAASNAGYCQGFASVHVEAGIRTLTPAYEAISDQRSAISIPNPAVWREFCMDRKNWRRGSQEPFPEQFNTRCAEAATGIHLAPVELDREFLLSEGYAEDRIAVVGNSVADALNDAKTNAATSTVFDRFPLLKDGEFVRFCIHRRENCMSKRRFVSILDAMGTLLEAGRTMLLISLFQTEAAIDRFGLRSTVDEWKKRYPHFIYSPVWPLYTDVIAAMERAAVCATDSGSMQEEMNVLGVPCVTLRFGSDRSESAMGGGNIIAPPVDATAIRAIIEYAWDNEEMRRAPKLYGSDVSRKSVDVVEEVLKKGSVFRNEDERLGIEGRQ